jgi:hypothetical protein
VGGTLEEVVSTIGTYGGKGIAVACDHTIDADVQKVFAQIEKDHGTYVNRSISILVKKLYVRMSVCVYVYLYMNICDTIDTDVQKVFAQIEKDHGTYLQH